MDLLLGLNTFNLRGGQLPSEGKLTTRRLIPKMFSQNNVDFFVFAVVGF